MNYSSGDGLTPTRKLLVMIAEDKREFFAILVYSLIQSLLLLAVPLAAQALVNVVVGGLYLQPLLVLTGALFFGLLGAGIISIIRFYLVEIMRERIFARVALRVADNLPRVRYRFLSERNGQELMNRFFDVVNVQKSWTKIAFDGPGAVLDIIVGVLLLGIYGTELLGLSAALLVVGFITICLTGYRGLKTSLAESKQKYRVAEWLEEMARCQDSLKFNSRPDYWLEEMDNRVVAFLRDRRQHFWIIVRQRSVYHVMAALSLAGMLGTGGYLVLQGDLTLGQLVAAELVIWTILKAAQKLVELAESFFDLLTALEKVSAITQNMELDKPGKISVPKQENGSSVSLSGIKFAYDLQHTPIFEGLELSVDGGEIVTVLGEAGSGKSTLIGLMAGFLKPQQGVVEVDKVDLRQISPESMARTISIISRHADLFTGTVLDNIATGREINLLELKDILQTYLSKQSLNKLEEGTDTLIPCSGSSFSGSEKDSLLLTRSLVCHPHLLLLDEALSHLSESQQKVLAETLRAKTDLTVISTLPNPYLVSLSDRIVILENGKIRHTGTPKEFFLEKSELLASDFPGLAGACRAILSREKGVA